MGLNGGVPLNHLTAYKLTGLAAGFRNHLTAYIYSGISAAGLFDGLHSRVYQTDHGSGQSLTGEAEKSELVRMLVATGASTTVQVGSQLLSKALPGVLKEGSHTEPVFRKKITIPTTIPDNPPSRC